VEIVDLDLLVQSPQIYARIIGGMEEKTLEGQQWRSILCSRIFQPVGEEGPFYRQEICRLQSFWVVRSKSRSQFQIPLWTTKI
jgi:hypothetical protein